MREISHGSDIVMKRLRHSQSEINLQIVSQLIVNNQQLENEKSDEEPWVVVN